MRIDWIIGQKYNVRDITNGYQAELVGFLIDQVPVLWNNSDSYSTQRDDKTYLVFKFEYKKGNYEFGLARPTLREYFPNYADSENSGYSEIIIQMTEYGCSIESLILKLKRNYVFTPKLCYNAVYKQNFNPETDLN